MYQSNSKENKLYLYNTDINQIDQNLKTNYIYYNDFDYIRKTLDNVRSIFQLFYTITMGFM